MFNFHKTCTDKQHEDFISEEFDIVEKSVLKMTNSFQKYK